MRGRKKIKKYISFMLCMLIFLTSTIASNVSATSNDMQEMPSITEQSEIVQETSSLSEKIEVSSGEQEIEETSLISEELLNKSDNEETPADSEEAPADSEEAPAVDEEAPDELSVEFLIKEMEKAEGQTKLLKNLAGSNTLLSSHHIDVEVVDTHDNPISNSGVSGISMGYLDGQNPESDFPKTISIDEGGLTKHYDFVKAKVGEQRIVFLGEYKGTIYYSTDGISAIKLGDKIVRLVYHKYYNVTFGENIDEGGVVKIHRESGDFEVTNSSNNPVKVMDGERLIWSVKTNLDTTQNPPKRYRVASISSTTSEHNDLFTDYEYGNTFDIGIDEDCTINISYNSDGKSKLIVVGGFDSGNVTNVEGDMNYAGVYEYTPGVNELKFSIQTARGQLIANLDCNDQPVEIAAPTISARWQQHETILKGDDGITDIAKITTRVRKHLIVGGGAAKYDIEITISKLDGGPPLTNEFILDPQWGTAAFSKLTLRLYAENRRGNDGIEAYWWDYREHKLQLSTDGEKIAMNDYHLAPRGCLHFFKAKPGYYIDSVDVHKKFSIPLLWSVIDKTPFNDIPIYNGQNIVLHPTWRYVRDADFRLAVQKAKEAGLTDAAFASSYTTPTALDRFGTEVKAKKIRYKVEYDHNISDPSVQVMNLPASGNQYTIGEHFVMQPGSTPYDANHEYVFLGYYEDSDPNKLYSPEDVFTILESNLNLANVDPQHPQAGTFKFIAKFQKADEAYKVNHILKTPFKIDANGMPTDELNIGANGEPIITNVTIQTDHCTYIGSNDNVAFAIPLTDKNDPRVDGYEVDEEDPLTKMEQQLPFPVGEPKVLTVVYKQETVTVKYESNNTDFGSVSDPTPETPSLAEESRLYFSGDDFKGSTASPKWNAKFIGWIVKGKDPSDSSNILSTDLKFIPDKHQSETYVAHFNEMFKLADLTIKKDLTGDTANMQAKFNFTLTIQKPVSSEAPDLPLEGFAVEGLSGVNKLTFDSENQVHFTLAKDEQVKIIGLPVGWSYTLVEDNSGYTTTYKLNDVEQTASNVLSFNLREQGDSVTCKNMRESIPPTGLESIGGAPWLFTMITTLLAAGYLFAKRWRRSKTTE